MEKMKEFILNEPYYAQNYMYQTYWNAIFENHKNYSNAELNKYIDFGIETFKNVKCVSQVCFSAIFERVEIMENIIKKLEKIEIAEKNSKIEQIKEIMIKEYNTNSEFILDYRRNNRTKAESINSLKQYINILKTVNIIVD